MNNSVVARKFNRPACVAIVAALIAMPGCSTQSRVDAQFILISAAVTTREFADLAFPATNPLEDSSRVAAASLPALFCSRK